MPLEPPESTVKDHLWHPAYPVQEFGGLVFAYMGPLDKMPLLPRYDVLLAEGGTLKGALRPPRGRSPELQLASERGEPHGRAPCGVAAYGPQRSPVPHPGPFNAAGTAGLRGDRHRHAIHHDPQAGRRALGRRHLGEPHAAERAPDVHGRARDREGEPGVLLRSRGRYSSVGSEHPLDSGRRRPVGAVRPRESLPRRAGDPGTTNTASAIPTTRKHKRARGRSSPTPRSTT